jgi:hypothetical protein
MAAAPGVRGLPIELSAEVRTLRFAAQASSPQWSAAPLGNPGRLLHGRALAGDAMPGGADQLPADATPLPKPGGGTAGGAADDAGKRPDPGEAAGVAVVAGCPVLQHQYDPNRAQPEGPCPVQVPRGRFPPSHPGRPKPVPALRCRCAAERLGSAAAVPLESLPDHRPLRRLPGAGGTANRVLPPG